MRALTLENGSLDEFAAVMPSFWDELALMAAPDAASGHSWTREMLVSCKFQNGSRRRGAQIRVALCDPAARC